MKTNNLLQVFRRTLWLGLLVLGAPGLFAQDGIYADFVTSMGNFSCKLSYTYAPNTVANFIALATGERPWLDMNTGKVRTNQFFNGLIIHRVLRGYLIQSGSPNGDGTGGPGYVLKDETNALKHANIKYALGMAQTSWTPDQYHADGVLLPNTASSQFYITVTNIPQFDSGYTVFGVLSSGTNVVDAINRVATSNELPVTPVIISNVTIRRVGTGTNFNINAQSLPLVSKVPLQITKGQGKVTVGYSNQLYAHNRSFETNDLRGTKWNTRDLPIGLAYPLTTNYSLWTTNASQGFSRIARALYPSSTLAPWSLTNKTLRMIYWYASTNGLNGVTNTLTFNATNAGTMVVKDSYGTYNGTIDSYYWAQDIYRGYLWPIYYTYPGNDIGIALWFDFTSETAGKLNGTVYHWSGFPWYAIIGSFTLTP